MPRRKYKPIPKLPQPTIDKFWARVDKRGPDECWNYTGPTVEIGHGVFCDYPLIRIAYAHRLAHYIATGIDPKQKMVLHECANKICCNPNHLYAGTCSDNYWDMVRDWKPTAEKPTPGFKKPVLSDQDVRDIRTLYALGKIAQHRLAAMFGVSQSVISHIVTRARWKHVV